MMTLRSALTIMAGLYVRSVIFTSRSLLLAAGLAVLIGFAAVAGLLGSENPHERMGMFLMLLYIGSAGFAAQFAAQLYGLAATVEDVETGTAPYLYSRPLPRVAMLLGRYLPAAGFLVAAFSVANAVGAVLLLGPGQGLAAFAGAEIPLVAGLLCYIAVFALLGLLTRHGMVVGIMLILLFDQPLSMLPFPVRVVSVKYHLMCMVKAWVVVPARERLGTYDILQYCDTPGTTSLAVVALIAAAALTVAAWRSASKEAQTR